MKHQQIISLGLYIDKREENQLIGLVIREKYEIVS